MLCVKELNIFGVLKKKRKRKLQCHSTILSCSPIIKYIFYSAVLVAFTKVKDLLPNEQLIEFYE